MRKVKQGRLYGEGQENFNFKYSGQGSLTGKSRFEECLKGDKGTSPIL